MLLKKFVSIIEGVEAWEKICVRRIEHSATQLKKSWTIKESITFKDVLVIIEIRLKTNKLKIKIWEASFDTGSPTHRFSLGSLWFHKIQHGGHVEMMMQLKRFISMHLAYYCTILLSNSMH